MVQTNEVVVEADRAREEMTTGEVMEVSSHN